MNRDPIIGIDLGSSASMVATVLDERPQVIPNRRGNRSTPACIALSGDGNILTGEAALAASNINPELSLRYFKTLLGKKPGEVENR